MGRPLVEHPLIERFRATSPLASSGQYAQLVQRFVRTSGFASPAEATGDAVLAYVTSLQGESSRRKSISALEAFFGDLWERGDVAADPARNLSRLVRTRLESVALGRGLAQAGIDPDQLPLLTWRDVARAAFGMDTVPIVTLLNAVASPAIAVLSERLLGRLRRIERRDLDAFLSERVFPDA